MTYEKSGANQVRVAIPEGKNPFEVVERVRLEMCPGAKLRERDPAFDRIMHERIVNPIDLRSAAERLAALGEPDQRSVEERTSDLINPFIAPIPAAAPSEPTPARPEVPMPTKSALAFALLLYSGRLTYRQSRMIKAFAADRDAKLSRADLATATGFSIDDVSALAAELSAPPLSALVEDQESKTLALASEYREGKK